MDWGIGKDTFKYDSPNDGNDTITDFQLGDDKIDLSTLLSYNQDLGDNINDFVQFSSINGGFGCLIEIDANGDNSGTDVSIIIENISVWFFQNFVQIVFE